MKSRERQTKAKEKASKPKPLDCSPMANEKRIKKAVKAEHALDKKKFAATAAAMHKTMGAMEASDQDTMETLKVKNKQLIQFNHAAVKNFHNEIQDARRAANAEIKGLRIRIKQLQAKWSKMVA